MKVSFLLIHTIFRIILFLQTVWTVEVNFNEYNVKKTSLDLSSEGIISIKNIEKMMSLKELYLNNNPLIELPPEIEQLNLEELWLYGNQLTTLPIEITNLHGLVILDLGGNNIVESGDGTTTVGKKELRDKFGKRVVFDGDTIKFEQEEISNEVYNKYKKRSHHLQSINLLYSSQLCIWCPSTHNTFR